ncbi:MAG: Ig-like domain-containing protein [Treponema sp.]|nr:Ig-like domain-containing protein [Treponema sp.]
MKKHTVGLIFSVTLIVVLLASCYDLKIEDTENLDGSVTITFIHENMLGREGDPNFREDLHKFPRLGETLIADDAGIVGTGDPTFVWKRGDVTVGGSGGTYFPQEEEDVGVPFTVIAFRSGHVRGMLSDPSYPVIDTDPDKTDIADVIRTVEITGKDGELEAVIDTESALAEDGFRYVWMRSGPASSLARSQDFTPIRGATGKTYRLAYADRGRALKLVVIHLDYSYYAESPAFYPDVPEEIIVTPNPANVSPGGSAQFLAKAFPNASYQNVIWSVEPADLGTIGANGLFTANADLDTIGTEITVRATSAMYPEISGTAQITIVDVQPTDVIVTPERMTVPTGSGYGSGKFQFRASVLPDGAPQGVHWTLDPSDAGQIDQGGSVVSINRAALGTEVKVIAISDANPAARGEATISVVEPASKVTVTPALAYVMPGESRQFKVAVAPANVSQDVTWAVSPTSAGTITADGLLTVNPGTSTGTMMTVTATSVTYDLSGSATVKVVGVVIDGPDTIERGKSGTFTVRVQAGTAQWRSAYWSLPEENLVSPLTGLSDSIAASVVLKVSDTETMNKVIIRATAFDDPGMATIKEVNIGGPYPDAGMLNEWRRLVAGVSHAFALGENGKLWAWGNNDKGQLGIGKSGGNENRTRLDGNDWAMVATSRTNTYAIKKDGSLWGWGEFNGATSPRQIGADNDWATVSVSDHAGDENGSSPRTSIMAIKTDGTLWGWGTDGTYFGFYPSSQRRDSPVRVGTDDDWRSVSMGEHHAILLKFDGTLWGCGSNLYYAINTDGTNNANAGSDKTGLVQHTYMNQTWIAAVAGNRATAAIDNSGTLYTWGSQNEGQAGSGFSDVNGSRYPFKVFGFSNTLFERLSIGSWTEHMVVLSKDGTLWSWGSNKLGQLGRGNPNDADRLRPNKIDTVSNLKTYSTNGSFGMAVDANGFINVWGDNGNLQLGSTQPGPVDAPSVINGFKPDS